ncbi:MAG: STAS domain-containing protein [Acidobacteria bacterium]|nr:STAS domain-containing protein [Acidobacteriota bacterium]
MQIQRRRSGNVEVVSLEGRFDSTWANHVEHALSDVIASGQHHISIDLAGVRYISSVGLGVLVNVYRELRALDGTFSLQNLSDSVRHVLAITGLMFLIEGGPPAAPAKSSPAPAETRRVEKEGYSLEIFSLPASPVDAALTANPFRAGERPTAASLQTLRVEPTRKALGIGALDVNAEECLARLGDFVALAGCAAVQTSDGTAMPDYVQASGTLVPDIHVLYAIDVQGELTGACRFEANADAGPIRLSSLASDLLEASGSDEAAVVLVAETAALVGSTLRQSPGQEGSKVGVFTVPEIRDWLSFTPEPEYVRSLALIVGVISRRAGSALAAQLRPVNGAPGLEGHFHAVVFAYRPLKRGSLKLREAVNLCFESGQVIAVLHLLGDPRPIVGAGESELLRGFCWTGPIRQRS